MITLLVVEDQKKVYELLAQALRKEGYSFVDEASSGGIIKIIRKSNGEREASLGEKILELQNILLQTKDGEVYKSVVEEVEKPLIESALERADGNQLKAAKILGINRNTLRTKIKKLNINAKKWKIY